MRRIFGAKKKTNVVQGPSIEEASNIVGKRGDNLDQKIKKLDEQLLECKKKMSKMRNGPSKNNVKRRALQILKQKKMYESQRENLYNQQFSMEQISFTQQTMKDTVVQVSSLKQATTTFKQQFKEIDIDEVWDIKDEMEDMLEEANEIQEALSQSFGVPEEFDEDDLEAELEGLEDEVLDEELDEEIPSYLNVPNEDPQINEKETEQDEEVDEFGLPQVEKN
ncbi:charged multivesicular body protein [Anaeramoeba flamelloides]|uniref:Charged multivesicular body protein n=1 Tax=Anaeramoeba flamelloides TaxID=1746091 RepID=A0AAV7YLT2_9EUKA|nr:charged multivesicular body protein [Anaeramoeba flamelloides]KAJ6228709.1 charged multivesicular body protein [Anaeramoeba flamelloides]|eukprot:Anaeramoba_flamelloidesa883_136.p1 GENE.a883_136~~a883_136.p1  ORF type:complete len:222 (-),score=80.11 a883_136:124-789(-)